MFSFAKRRTGALQQARGRAAAARQKTAHARGNHAHRFLLAQMPAEIGQRGEVQHQQHTGKPERHITLLLPARARRRRGSPRRRWQGSFEDSPSDARGRPLRLPFPARRSFFRVVRTAAETLPSWQKVTNSGPGLTLAAARIFSCMRGVSVSNAASPLSVLTVKRLSKVSFPVLTSA